MTAPSSGNRITSFPEQLYRECEAMAKYAFASGLNIPSSLTTKLDQINTGTPAAARPVRKVTTTAPTPSPKPPNRRMPDLKAMALIHQELARVIAPAKPRGVLLLEKESGSRWYFLGPVPLVRQMMVLAIVSLMAFVGVSLSPSVSEQEIQQGLLNLSGTPLLLNILFLLAAAALGSSFAGLFQVNKYCTEGAYDPKFDSSYWVRFVLGLISGLILAELIFSYTSPDGVLDQASSTKGSEGLMKPILAMLGGFSSDLVFRILNRLVASVEMLVRGNPREQVNNQKQTVQKQAAVEVDQERVRLAAGLMSLNQKLGARADPKSISNELGQLVDRLTGVGEDTSPATGGTQNEPPKQSP